MFINPILGALTISTIRPPEPRKVERAAALAGVSAIANAAHAQYVYDRAEKDHGDATDTPERHAPQGDRSLLAGTTVATLNALHGADAEVIAHAMLSAAKAHGPIDPPRLKLIMQHLHDAGASDEDQDFVLQHLAGPPDIADVAAHVHDPATALEAYVVSTLMIDPEVPAEDAYLAELERRLAIPADALRAIGLKPHAG
jgi:uncharacterized membrane protein YebE (DUF533 family)